MTAPLDDGATIRPHADPIALRALWQTGLLAPDQAPRFAVELMMNGADSQALRELAGMDRVTRAEVEPLLDRVLSQLGVPPLDRDVAWRIAARHVAAGAVAGTISPYHAADSLYTLWIDHELARELGNFAGLIDAWEYGGVFGSREEVDAEIVKACEELLEEVGDPLPSLQDDVRPSDSGRA